jgi:hypothetical protein
MALGGLGEEVSVSILETLSIDLASMVDGLAAAQRDTAAADQAAEQIAVRAAVGGFVGIAANVARLREAIKQVHGSILAAATALTEVRGSVDQAPRQGSPEETAAALAPAAERITTVAGVVHAAIEKVSQAQKLASALLQGDSPGPMLARLEAIKQVLAQVDQRRGAAQQHVEAALKAVSTVGDAGN